jgi:hypothetical protein
MLGGGLSYPTEVGGAEYIAGEGTYAAAFSVFLRVIGLTSSGCQ